MADPLSAPAEDPFAQIIGGTEPAPAPPAAAPVPSPAPAPAVPAAAQQDNDPFAEFDQVGPSPVSATGAFARGAEKAALPAVGALPAIGAGAEAGAAVGSFGGPIGAAVGGVVGGIAGGVGGSYLLSEAQNWAVKKLPDSWRDKLGLDDRSARLDEAQHGTASFMGGLVPLAVTMNPTGAAARELPANATALQQIMAHPLTARMFGGGVMGGMEIGNEKLHGGDIDWRKAAISTTFGVIMNRPNRVGEGLTEIGAHPARAMLGRPQPATVAQAADAKVMGPGVTEGVFRGTEEQAPAAAQTAQENARIEKDALGDHPEPDLHGIARQMEPDLFAKYDELLKRRETFEAWHGEGPGHEMAEKHLAATNAEIAEMSPTVAAAYRRASDTVGTGSIDAEQFPSFAAMLAARENSPFKTAAENIVAAHEREAREAGVQNETSQPAGEPGVSTGGEAPPIVGGPERPADAGAPIPQRTIGDQRSAIAADVTGKLIAAGRPEEEARAAGQLIAARYITRAGRFEGKLGTAEELYAREGAAIAGPGGRPQAPAGAPQEPVKPSPSAGAAELPKTPDAAKKVLRGRAAADPKTWSLYEFLASEGGLKPTDDLKSILGGKNPFVPGFGPLLRPTGLSLEDALTRAKENSYVFDPADMAHVPHDATRPQAGELTKTANDLHELIDEESRGRKQYRNDHVPAEAKVNADEERGSILDALHRELRDATGDEKLKVDPALEDRVVEIIQKEGEHDVLAAYERAIMEDHDRFEGLRNDRRSAEPISGWDSPDAEATPSGGTANTGDRGQAGIPGEAAREDHGAEPRDAGKGNRAPTDAIAAWDDLVSQRLARRETLKPTGGFNTDRGRNGALLRGGASQIWKPGNTVNVGFLKDLLVAKENGDGSFELLSKPDQNGMSRVYEMKPHEGISGNARKVDFLERARDVLASHEMAQSVDEYFQRIYEPGAEGKPQALIPGVEAVTDRDRVQTAANKPLAPKVAQKPVGGLFGDSMDQNELFQRDRVQTPEFGDSIDSARKILEGGKWESIGRGIDGYMKPTELLAEHERSLSQAIKDELARIVPKQLDVKVAQSIRRGYTNRDVQGIHTQFSDRNPLIVISLEAENPIGVARHEAIHHLRQQGFFTEGEWEVLSRVARDGNWQEAFRINERYPSLSQSGKLEEAIADGYRAWKSGEQLSKQATTVFEKLKQFFDAIKEKFRNILGRDFTWEELFQKVDEGEIGSREGNKPLDEDSYQDKSDQGQGGKILEQTARGKISIAPGRRPIITLMKDANASTFVHESGHQFLEELMRDTNHPDAPPGLRDDAQTVRDWLGVTDDIETKHHEKFARGFEQYVREGVAPSPELAGVFAKFRNWLLSIYQSIKGLGTEISPEIRSVFDRMLEMEPQRTVVAPERASPTLLHDIHEAEAQHIEPHEAEGAMDRIVAETARHIAELPPEIQREHETAAIQVEQARAAAAGESGPGAGEPSKVVGNSGEPGAESGGGAGGAEHREVKPGGSGAGTESAGVQRPDPRSKLGDHAGTALAPGPADLFGARESPFTDRAGNIRLDTLNTAEDVKQALRDSAAENNDFIGDRRGVVTDGQVLELANDIGMSGAEDMVKKHVTGQAYNAEQVVALRKLLRESAANVSTAAKKAATSGLDEDVMAYAQAKDRLQMVQKTVAGVTAEAGRALRAFRTLPGEADTTALEQMIKDATGKTLFQLKQEAKLASAIDTPQNVNKFMQEVDKHSAGGMLLEGWINGLLSAFSTQSTNVVGNAIFAIQHFGPEKAIAGLIGGAAHALGREGTYTRVGEVGAALQGVKEGAAPALAATGTAFRKGASVLLPGEETPASGILEGIVHDSMVPRGTLDEAATMRDVGAGIFGVVRGVRDAIMTGGALLRAGGVEGSPLWDTKYAIQGQIPDIQIRGMNVLPIGTAIRLPGRFLSTMDTFFRSLNYSASKNTIAYRMASDEGLTGVAFDQRVAEIRNNPDDAVMAEARGVATETTFMDKGGEFVRAINNLTSRQADLPLLGKVAPLKFIAPFTNVVSRILEQTLVKRTPFGFFSKELRADLSGKNGNIAQDTASARMLLGSVLMVGFGSLASEGYITGSGPKDPKENAIWRLTYQPHSVRIGDMQYQVQKLGTLGMLMGMAADVHDMAHLVSEDKYTEAAAYLLHAIVQNVLDQSALQGPADTIKAIESPEQFGPQYVKSFLSSFVPYSSMVNSIARARDPYIRQTWSVLDAIKAKLPGYSEELHPRIDIWGESMPTRNALGGTGVTGIYMQKVQADPVNKALLDLGIHPGSVEKKIRNIELTPQQYEDYARIAGRMTKQRLDVIVNSSSFQTLPPYQRAMVLTNTFKESRAAASGMVKMKNPNIVNDATQALLKKINKK